MGRLYNIGINKIKEDIKNWMPWFALFTVYCLWNANFPMTSDDLYWKYGINITKFGDIWNETLHMGNGRILGNFGIMILVRCPWIKVLYKSILMCLLPYFLIQLLNISKRYVKIVCVILIMFPGNYMFAQIYVWTSGFQNYFPPIILFLSCLVLIKKRRGKLRIIDEVYLLLCGVAETLFLETATLMFIEVGIILVVLAWKKEEGKVASVIFLLSSLVGFVILLGLPYFIHSNGNINGYRKILLDSGIRKIVVSAVSHVEKFVQTIAGCTFLIILISIVMIYILLKKKVIVKNDHIKYNIALFFLAAFPVYSILNNCFIKQWVFSEGWMVYVTIGLFIGYLWTISWIIWAIKEERRLIYLIILFLALFSYAPMLLLETVRERNCYISYLYLVAFILLLLENISFPEECLRVFEKFSITIVLSIILVIFMVCAEWNYVSYMREKYCERMVAKREETIYLPALPHAQLLQADADANYWKYYTDSKYGYDIKIEFLEWYSWLVRKN